MVGPGGRVPFCFSDARAEAVAAPAPAPRSHLLAGLHLPRQPTCELVEASEGLTSEPQSLLLVKHGRMSASGQMLTNNQ